MSNDELPLVIFEEFYLAGYSTEEECPKFIVKHFFCKLCEELCKYIFHPAHFEIQKTNSKIVSMMGDSNITCKFPYIKFSEKYSILISSRPSHKTFSGVAICQRLSVT